MIRSYEARRVRLRDPSSTVRDGVGSHKYNAADDADAVRVATTLHAGFYDPVVDQITVWELVPDHPDRLVVIIEGSDA
jgi:hypothetical protein